MRHELLLGSAVALALCLLIGAVAWSIVFGLTRRLSALSAATSALAAGDLDAELPNATGKDEVDRMAEALHVFQDAARARASLEVSARSARSEAESSRLAFDQERAEKERRLEEATGALGVGLVKLAGGDLAYRIETPFEPRLDKLRVDFNAALDKLRQTMLSVRDNADGIKSGVEEIAHASDNLSSRTEEQAARLEKTAAALDEITATLKTSADGVKNASGLVSTADHDAREGRGRRQAGGGGDGHDLQILAADRADHRRHRRNRVPDQSAGAQRRRRGGAGGRGRAGASRWWRAKCGRWRSARRTPPRRSRR